MRSLLTPIVQVFVFTKLSPLNPKMMFIHLYHFYNKIICCFFQVNAPWLSKFYTTGDTYIFPGISAATLGGTRNFNSWNREVDKNDSQGIRERCTQIVPQLSSADVIREWVGLRPYRPVVRVQPEIIDGLKVHIVYTSDHWSPN